MKLKIIHDHCDRPYLARLTLFALFGFSLKLHIFLRSDEDRELHDHPWSFWTFVLCGMYYERTPERVIARKPWQLPQFRPAKWRHRVILPKDDNGHEIPCATLVFTSPYSREWGFWRDGEFIPWQQFVSERDC